MKLAKALKLGASAASALPKAGTPAFDKLVKRQILGRPQAARVRFPKGMGDLCLAETQDVLRGIRVDGADSAQCQLTANSVHLTNVSLRALVALTAQLTTAREVLWIIGEGRAGAIGEIKERCAEIPWPLFLSRGAAVALRVESTASHVFHEGKVQELVAKALAKHGITEAPKVSAKQLLDVRLFEDRLTLSLSLAGRPLYQRHYKKSLAGTATIKEDLAAACVRATLAFASASQDAAFHPAQVLVPFAGSGTLGFEAAIALQKIPPWVFFGPLGAEAFPCTPQTTVEFAKRSSLVQMHEASSEPVPVAFIDDDADQAEALRLNSAHFNELLTAHGGRSVPFTVLHSDFFECTWPTAAGPLLIAMNPPFGLRLEDKSAVDRLYPRIAKTISRVPGELAGFVLAPSEAVGARFTAELRGMHSAVRPFNHGGRTVYLVVFNRAKTVMPIAKNDIAPP